MSFVKKTILIRTLSLSKFISHSIKAKHKKNITNNNNKLTLSEYVLLNF